MQAWTAAQVGRVRGSAAGAWTAAQVGRVRESAAGQAVGAWTAEQAGRVRESAVAQAAGTWTAEQARRVRESAAAQAAGAWTAEQARRVRESAAGTWTAARVGRVRARVGGRAGHVLAAGGVRAAATALELTVGPIGGALVAAGAEAAVLAIATDAVRRALAGREAEVDRGAVLAVVIAELTRTKLCESHVADGWRLACGLGSRGRGSAVLGVELRRATFAVVGSRVTGAALRRAGWKRLLWIGSALTLARLPGEVRRACELVRRADLGARAFAGERAAAASAAASGAG
ncbi:hypothetical protein OV090_37570 [Nannocystis sp. RBIL2]|uniref:hypothetical protein n=1 Tax=Nannocystis sp. RBIL2 TaxID=2996788 RepID=UPI00226F7EF7|nr:hypothetical protein [Nannocystis sp. RBIL2]MCY1070512.1 hypothetical protein [Nannocystis sp. RBIL2]